MAKPVLVLGIINSAKPHNVRTINRHSIYIIKCVFERAVILTRETANIIRSADGACRIGITDPTAVISHQTTHTASSPNGARSVGVADHASITSHQTTGICAACY